MGGGGPGAYAAPAARAYAPPAPPTDPDERARSLENKRQRYAARMRLLGTAQGRLDQEFKRRIDALPPPSHVALGDGPHRPLAGLAEAARRVPLPKLPPQLDLTPFKAAADRLALNNLGVEMAKLSDDTYFNDLVANAQGKLVPIHFKTHNPDGTFVLSDPPEGWERDEVIKDDESGFMACLYHSTFTGPRQYVLAFRGTDADPNFKDELEKDAGTDALQGTGMYTKAFDLTERLTKKIKLKYPGIILAGHSLGGAQASLGGLITGNPTYTFNSGGLHVNSMARAHISAAMRAQNEPQIQAFYADNDPLNYYQDHPKLTKGVLKVVTEIPLHLTPPGMPPLPNPLDPLLNDPHSLPQAVGVRHLILSGSTARFKGADAGGHSVQPIINVMEQQKTADTATLQRYLALP